MFNQFIVPFLTRGHIEVAVYFTLAFLALVFVLIKGVSWVFSKHRTSREETERLLATLRKSVRVRFLATLVLILLCDFAIRALIEGYSDDPRFMNAAIVGTLLSALFDVFLASSVVLVVSAFTRPISQIVGAFFDFVQFAVLAAFTGYLVQSLGDFGYFRSQVSNIPIALVLCLSSVLYSIAGTILWILDERRKSLAPQR